MCIYFYIISYCSCPHDVKTHPSETGGHASPPIPLEEVARLTGRRCRRADPCQTCSARASAADAVQRWIMKLHVDLRAVLYNFKSRPAIIAILYTF